MIGKARSLGSCPVLRLSIASQRDDNRRLCFLLCSEFPGHGVTIHTWHADIEQHDVRLKSCCPSQSTGTVEGGRHRETFKTEQHCHCFCRILVVVYHENSKS